MSVCGTEPDGRHGYALTVLVREDGDDGAVLWYVLTGTRGRKNRVHILQAVDERPLNANQLAGQLDLDYTTSRHHLEVLLDNGVVRSGGDGYGAVYLLSERGRDHWNVVEEILDQVDWG